jgi:hypothetical protein
MSDTKPPAPRYRIVERNKRLVTIDSWDKRKAGTTTPSPPPRRSARAPRGQAAILADLLVALVCAGVRDAEGRRVLPTSEYFDGNGPRDITLSMAGEKRLGTVMFSLAMVVMIAVAAMVAFPITIYFALMATMGASFAINSVARPAITRWLDGLEDHNG